MATPKIIELNDENICKICENQLGKYTCPQCNILYCTVNCYQSTKHAECSEDFYKQCVMNELSAESNGEVSKKQMNEILKRLHEDNNEMEISDRMDSDDDDDIPDLAARLAHIDLDNVEQVWSLLVDDEKQEFEALVQTGDITKLVPIWKPWWESKIKRKLVIEMDEANSINYKEECPKIISDIKDFQEIFKMKPAECVKFNLLNVIASYVSVVRYFNGDHFEFPKEAVYLLTSLSINLQSNSNFDSYASALESVHQLSLMNDWIAVSSENKEKMYQDVDDILEGPEELNKTYYLKAALSDIYQLINVSKKAQVRAKSDNEFTKRFLDTELPENKIISREKLKSCLKKVEYYLSYVNTYRSAFD